jgi:hypothetical protein
LNNCHKYLHNNYMPKGTACSELRTCGNLRWKVTQHNNYYTLNENWQFWAYLFWIINTKFKNSVPTSQRTHHISIVSTDWLMLLTEKITVYSKRHKRKLLHCVSKMHCFKTLNHTVHIITTKL